MRCRPDARGNFPTTIRCSPTTSATVATITPRPVFAVTMPRPRVRSSPSMISRRRKFSSWATGPTASGSSRATAWRNSGATGKRFFPFAIRRRSGKDGSGFEPCGVTWRFGIFASPRFRFRSLALGFSCIFPNSPPAPWKSANGSPRTNARETAAMDVIDKIATLPTKPGDRPLSNIRMKIRLLN